MIIFTVLAILAKNCPKWPFLAFFSRTAHQNFLIFCSKHSLWSLKIITFSLCGENLKNSPFWPNLTKLAGCWNSWNSLKNLKVGVFETDFKQVPFVFRQTTCTYSERWGPVENCCDPPAPPPAVGGRRG